MWDHMAGQPSWIFWNSIKYCILTHSFLLKYLPLKGTKYLDWSKNFAKNKMLFTVKVKFISWWNILQWVRRSLFRFIHSFPYFVFWPWCPSLIKSWWPWCPHQMALMPLKIGYSQGQSGLPLKILNSSPGSNKIVQ